MTSFSIYIPSVYANITEAMISKTFHRMEMGKVKHVELIAGKGKSNRAHVFFDEMYDTEASRSMQTEIEANNTCKLAYAKNEHVFWIMLKSRREYDGKSNAGEYVEQVAVEQVAVPFTEEELDFMDAHFAPDADTSLVDVAYVESIENENYHLCKDMAELQKNYQRLFNEYNMIISANHKNFDLMDEWASLAQANQLTRLRHSILGAVDPPVVSFEEVEVTQEAHYTPNTSKMTVDELSTEHQHQVEVIGF